MKTNEAKSLKAGSEIVYDDGRGAATATVIDVDEFGMLVQFDDRASTTRIQFSSQDWMKYISAK